MNTTRSKSCSYCSSASPFDSFLAQQKRISASDLFPSSVRAGRKRCTLATEAGILFFNVGGYMIRVRIRTDDVSTSVRASLMLPALVPTKSRENAYNGAHATQLSHDGIIPFSLATSSSTTHGHASDTNEKSGNSKMPSDKQIRRTQGVRRGRIVKHPKNAIPKDLRFHAHLSQYPGEIGGPRAPEISSEIDTNT
eukprot:IDg23480t1